MIPDQTGRMPLSKSMMTLYIRRDISYMCDIEMAVRATYDCHMQAGIHVAERLDTGL